MVCVRDALARGCSLSRSEAWRAVSNLWYATQSRKDGAFWIAGYVLIAFCSISIGAGIGVVVGVSVSGCCGGGIGLR